jgi:hypothetical protein
MKKFISLILLINLVFSQHVFAQIENVYVETYYVSDTNDATDTTGGTTLEDRSKTYRIYVDLLPGYKIKKIYGDANHTLKISSTANFYNNHDRPTAYFGYLINKSWFPDNPLLGLDSWLTLGLPTKTNNGVLKTDDVNGSFIGGTNNYGGSAAIPGGLLVNNSVDVGIPLTTADGMSTNNNVLGQWLDNGFKNMAGVDTTVFGPLNVGSAFISNSAFLQQNSGVMGSDPDNNKVLVAQLTTKGEISFELNIEVIDTAGNVIKLVADNTVLLPGEQVSPSLKYPAECGCKNANYLEYNAAYGCDDSTACKTLIVCGCMDTMACNYDAAANKNIESLCCYPGYCNDRDLEVVCPELVLNRIAAIELNLFPNPADKQLTLQVPATNDNKVQYTVYNAYGSLVFAKDLGILGGNIFETIDITKLERGLYLLRFDLGKASTTKRFIKN